MDRIAYELLTGNKIYDVRDNWKTLCPAHLETNPSFFIHKETYICHCFGCGIRGTLDWILAGALEKDIFDIRHELGIPSGVAIGKKITPPPVEEFSRSWLAGFPKITTHPLLKNRGFNSETVILAGARWDGAASRIVFPLRSVGSPTVIGAAGRSLKPTDQKWYFYWTTRKGAILYQPIDTSHINIIVEGVLDVLWLLQHGYAGVVALLGAQATKTQIELIKQNTDEVVLFLDNDEAGRIGQTKLARALTSSLKVTFAKYPEGKKDPQELSHKELNTAIKDKLTYVQYCSNHS